MDGGRCRSRVREVGWSGNGYFGTNFEGVDGTEKIPFIGTSWPALHSPFMLAKVFLGTHFDHIAEERETVPMPPNPFK